MLLGKVDQYFGFEMKPQGNEKLASKFKFNFKKADVVNFQTQDTRPHERDSVSNRDREKEHIFFRSLEKAYYFVNVGRKIYKPAPKGWNVKFEFLPVAPGVGASLFILPASLV